MHKVVGALPKFKSWFSKTFSDNTKCTTWKKQLYVQSKFNGTQVVCFTFVLTCLKVIGFHSLAQKWHDFWWIGQLLLPCRELSEATGKLSIEPTILDWFVSQKLHHGVLPQWWIQKQKVESNLNSHPALLNDFTSWHKHWEEVLNQLRQCFDSVAIYMSKQIDGGTTFSFSDLVGLGQFSGLGPFLRCPAMKSVEPKKSHNQWT